MPVESSRAVFLSYASQDAEAARRLCEALRSGGVEVWFDADGGLEHGDEWDAKIRRQIKECVLFIAVISQNTQARHEGYFRIEWDLAAERARGIASGVPFLLPVVIDDTREPDALVPDRFRLVQWTRLPGGKVTPEVRARYLKLWSHRTGVLKQAAVPDPAPPAVSPPPARRRPPFAAGIAIAVVGLAIAAAFVWPRRPAKPPPPVDAGPPPAKAATNTRPAPPAEPTPDPKSIAVLPFENLSAEPDSALFANGMHEEMLTALAKVSALTVISRTSVLPYRDPAQRNLREISAELGVGSVVEGSVRRAGQRVRIAVQLVDVRTRRQLWADAFEREFADVFAIQAAVAQEVARILQARLTPREQSTLAQRPSTNARAYELYIEAKSMHGEARGRTREEVRAQWDEMVAKLEEATRLDPQFAAAFAQLGYTHATMYFFSGIDSTPARAALAERAVATARRLAPDSGPTHVAAGYFAYACQADYPAALRHFEAALQTSPNDSVVHFTLGLVLRRLGRPVEAAAALERSVALDPLENRHYANLIQSLMTMRRYAEVVAHAERRARLKQGEARPTVALNLAQFELDGDRLRLVQGWKDRAAAASEPEKTSLLAEAELAAGQLAEGLRLLSDPALEKNRDARTLVESLLRRLELSHRLGRSAEVEALAARIRSSLGAVRRVRFGDSVVLRAEMTLAALSGQRAGFQAAVAQLQERGRADRFSEANSIFQLGLVHLLLGDEAAALDCLQQNLTGTGPVGPRGIRIHPLWSKMNGNPRFEAIVRQARPL